MKAITTNRMLALLLALNLASTLAVQAQDDPAPDTNTLEQAETKEAEPSQDSEAKSQAGEDNHRKGGVVRHHTGDDRDAMVVFGHNAEVKEGETAEALVVIGGSAVVRGKVRDAAVVIGGNLQVMEGAEVGDAAVAVMGNIDVRPGAVVNGEAVAVGGKVSVANGGKVVGQTQEVDFGINNFHFEWLQKWLVECVFKMRPLAPRVGWVWPIAGVFFLLYLLIAAVFQRPVRACVDELQRRPATTFMLGLLTKILLPIVFMVLAITGVGLLVLPFLFAGLLMAAMVGKVALLQGLGQAISTRFGKGAPVAALVNFLIGAALLTVLYMIPVLGLIAFAITSVWGLGAATSAAFASLKKELPEKPSAPLPPPPPPSYTPAPPAGPPPVGAYTLSAAVPGGTPEASWPGSPAPEASGSGTPPPASFTPPPPTPPPPPTLGTPFIAPVPPVYTDLLAYRKASFWERMGAAFLDVVLVGVLGAIVGGPPMLFLVALAYFAGMWAWQGTTIGGIVVGLKVVRYDGRPLNLAVAIVRGLAAAFSIIVLFLGFFWIAWDRDRQGWHDKIAGTIVIRLPKGTPLLCL